VILSMILVFGICTSFSQDRFRQFTLDNGLKVILEENRNAPVVALQIWVDVGSGDERDEEAGMCHFIEHMIFKGTEKRKVSEMAREIESMGGSINAYTSYDQTVFHVTLASRFADTGLDILADAIQHSTFDPVELEREREVILEEIRMGQDDPSRKLFRQTMATLFQEHPYRRPVIGLSKRYNHPAGPDGLLFQEVVCAEPDCLRRCRRFRSSKDGREGERGFQSFKPSTTGFPSDLRRREKRISTRRISRKFQGDLSSDGCSNPLGETRRYGGSRCPLPYSWRRRGLSTDSESETGKGAGELHLCFFLYSQRSWSFHCRGNPACGESGEGYGSHSERDHDVGPKRGDRGRIEPGQGERRK